MSSKAQTLENSDFGLSLIFFRIADASSLVVVNSISSNVGRAEQQLDHRPHSPLAMKPENNRAPDLPYLGNSSD